jgi:hypothetical protein
LVSDIKGGTQTEGVCKRGAEKDFGPKSDEVTRKIRWELHVAQMRQKRTKT